MKDIACKVTEMFEQMDFEVQPMSFQDFTASGGMAELGDATNLPECDSSKILSYFPDLFLIHHSASPDRGIFFVTYANDNLIIHKSIETILLKYFPKDLLLVGSDSKGNLVAKWIGSQSKIIPLVDAIHKRLEN